MALNQYSESILAPDLEARIAKIKEADFEQPDRIKQAFLRLSHQCWSGTQKYISIQELLEEIGCDSDVGERDRQTAYNILK